LDAVEEQGMDFDPLEEPSTTPTISTPTNTRLTNEALLLQARSEAFRDLADRFYMLWWNMPGMTLRQADREIQDMFRMYMDLAPSLGVSRNGIPELRECCGRKRTWGDDPLTGDPSQTLIMPPATDPIETLGWCPGDIIRRITRFFGAKYCEKCDRRRRAINAFFRCGSA
jgi:hypothetical protein